MTTDGSQLSVVNANKALNPFIGTYPPGPPSCEEGGNGERLCEGFGFPERDLFAQSHQNS